MGRYFCLTSRSGKDLVGHLITIKEYIRSDWVTRILEPQSGSYLRVEPRYSIRIYDDYIADCLEQLDLSMDECFERYPWFFTNESP